MKFKKIALTLSTVIIFSAMSTCVYAIDNVGSKTLLGNRIAIENTETDSNKKFDLIDGNAHITAAVLVENGIAYSLTQEEYLQLMNQEKENNTELNSASRSDYSLRSINYSFKPKSKRVDFSTKDKKRVSVIYDRASTVAVTDSMSFTRTVSKSAGVSISSKVLSEIDTAVSASYSLTKSASSSISQIVTGTFKPNTAKRYCAIVFTPRLATVTGTLTERIDIMGSTTNTYACTLIYPVTGTTGYLDGIYELMENDSKSAFPEIA